MELSDGSVLFLFGQYLYDYVDPLADDGDKPLFPCTDFTLVSHKEFGGLSIQCGGSLLKYDSLDMSFWEDPYWHDDIPEDMTIFTDRTFDQLKRNE